MSHVLIALSLLIWSLKSLVVIVLAGLTSRFLRGRVNAATSRLVWLAAFGLAVTIPLLSLTVPAAHLPVLTETALDAKEKILSIQQPLPNQNPSIPTGPTFQEPRTLADALLGFWILGVVVSLGRLIKAMWDVRTIRRRSETSVAGTIDASNISRKIGIRPTPILVSKAIHVPAACGFFVPAVVVPESSRDWSDDVRQQILTHELSHIKRGDWIALLFLQLVAAFQWFNPLAWWAVRQFRESAEIACDDEVVLMNHSPVDYASTLLDFAKQSDLDCLSPVALPIVSRTQIESRIAALVSEFTPRRKTTLLGMFALVGSTLLTGIAIASVQPLTLIASDEKVEFPRSLSSDDGLLTGYQESFLPEGIAVKLIEVGLKPPPFTPSETYYPGGYDWSGPLVTSTPTCTGALSFDESARYPTFRIESKQARDVSVVAYLATKPDLAVGGRHITLQPGKPVDHTWLIPVDAKRHSMYGIPIKLGIASGGWESVLSVIIRDNLRDARTIKASLSRHRLTISARGQLESTLTDFEPLRYAYRVTAIDRNGLVLPSTSYPQGTTLTSVDFPNSQNINMFQIERRPWKWLDFSFNDGTPRFVYSPPTGALSVPAAPESRSMNHKLPSGSQVSLLGLKLRMSDGSEKYWRADGGGWVTPTTHFQSPNGLSEDTPCPPTRRYVALRLNSPSKRHASLVGFVPHLSQGIQCEYLDDLELDYGPQDFLTDEQFFGLPPNRSYQVGLADGPWSLAKSIPLPKGTQLTKGNLILSIDRHGALSIGHSGRFESEPLERFPIMERAYRATAVDKNGQSLNKTGPNNVVLEEDVPRVDHIEIRTCPWQWVKFTGIHLDPP